MSAVEHLYVHVPFCETKCSYCAFYSETGPVRDGFADDILLELGLFDLERSALKSIYIGGGTPTLLGARELSRLCRGIMRETDVRDLQEWTIEANPGSLSDSLAGALREEGITRVSIGAQSFSDSALRLLGRAHSARDIHTAFANARRAGFDSIGLDLIAGIPGVTREMWKDTLRQAAELRPDHMSVYLLSIEPRTSFERSVRNGSLTIPDDEHQMDALEIAEELLDRHGYQRYEISNYAPPGCECRHNLAVWRGEDYLGLGPAAASRIGLDRYENAPDLAGWSDALRSGGVPGRCAQKLTKAEDSRERLLTRLRLNEGLDLADHRDPSVPEIAKRLEALMAAGITERLSSHRWRLSKRGREVADAVMRELIT